MTPPLASPLMLPIARVTNETPRVKTFTFRHVLRSRPGQFVMVWLPGIDQKPFSIGNDTGTEFSLTIFSLGGATQKIFTMNVGDRVGITGHFGTFYRFAERSHVITVAGGYGAAPLGFLAERACAQQCSVDFCVGARTKQDVLFERRAKKAGSRVFVSTDDGSKGHHGRVTEILLERLEEARKKRILKKTKIFACGPELMQVAIAKIGKEWNVPVEISLERYMKCGFGICGNCCVDDTGQTTCVQGTVMSGNAALRLTEFGKYHRDKTGIRHNF